MKRVWIALLLHAACGSAESSGNEQADGGGTGTEHDAGGGPGSDGGGGGVEDVAACWHTCDAPSDCSLGTALTDTDNYDCEQGLCIYRGCNSTAECEAVFMSDDYACGTVGGLDTPSCYETCSTASDCVLASPAFDLDNYRCTEDGLCEYTGCNDHDECEAAHGTGYGCYEYGGGTVAYCTARCAVPSDCVVAGGGPLYDADNYTCEDGFCQFIGCNSESECQSSLMSTEYTCTTL